MAGGLIGIGEDIGQVGERGLQRVADAETSRNITNRQIQQQNKNTKMSNIGTGAAIGAMAAQGTAVGGPWGAVIGAGIGLLMS